MRNSMASKTILSLTPGFSQVLTGVMMETVSTVFRYCVPGEKTVETVCSRRRFDTQLKLGVNEIPTLDSQPSYG